MRPLHIGYICVEDPRDRRTWSGTNFHLLDALERAGHRVEVIAPLRPTALLLAVKAFNLLSTRMLGKRFHYRDSRLLSKAYARLVERQLNGRPLDLLLAPAGLAAVAYLQTRIPVVHINDRCLHGALNYHRILRDLFAWSLRDVLAVEQQALQRAELTVYASDWASEGARSSAPAVADRIYTIPFGANFVSAPASPPVRGIGSPWRLLFMGVDWQDKGGAIAVEALRHLRYLGHSAQLTVVGCVPPAEVEDPDMQVVGFLNKNDPMQRDRLAQLFHEADALILPTRFEAYGIVCCEAAAYGLPVFATRTGGIPTIVQDGITGRLFPVSDGGAPYAEAIREVLLDPVRWSAMRQAARSRYE
ncbi:MAG: glycosyltransferase family 4 protein, partial [Flavobacteriales bacterium]|nr:glycosyltransferase family 4 protein [Flavobacteriales bacterium]